VGLVVAGQPCLVVGGGTVAGRKIGSLLTCGATVTVVAPEAHRAMAVLARDGAIASIDGAPLDVQLRPYRPGEAAGYRLAIAATGDPAVDGRVFADASAAGVWVNSADDPAHCTVVLPAVHRQGPVTVSVSTGGASPALASWLRDRLASAAGPDLATMAELLDEARRTLHAAGGSTEAVDWRALLDGALPDLVADGHLDEARALIGRAVVAAGPGAPDDRGPDDGEQGPPAGNGTAPDGPGEGIPPRG
jgi:siroheme synthase-like protein